MVLNKEEFEVLVMLYAANTDGNIQPEEVDVILEKANADSFKKVGRLFKDMGDAEVIDCIRDHKQQFVPTKEDVQRLMVDFRSIIEADNHCSTLEKYMLNAIEKILS